MFLFINGSLFAQTDNKTTSSLAKPDTLKIVPVKHSVRTATLLSTILPGAGQIYNHKYWKTPVIYAAFGGLAYLLKNNNDQYNKYKRAYISRTDNDATTISDPEYDKYSDDNILTLKNAYQHSRDFNVICMIGVYVLNIVDAAVDAHLYTFDVSDNLSMEIRPTLIYTSINNIPTTGFGLNLKF
jgi:hypothetical protein